MDLFSLDGLQEKIVIRHLKKDENLVKFKCYQPHRKIVIVSGNICSRKVYIKTRLFSYLFIRQSITSGKTGATPVLLASKVIY